MGLPLLLMIMTMHLSGWSCVGAETAQMIHELLSTTVAPSAFFFFFSSSKSLYLHILSLLISTTIIDRSLSLWVEGRVDSRFLMDPKIVFEVKVL